MPFFQNLENVKTGEYTRIAPRNNDLGDSVSDLYKNLGINPSASVQGLDLVLSLVHNDSGQVLIGHGTGNGPDAEDDHFPTTETKRSLSYADAARGTKRYVTFE